MKRNRLLHNQTDSDPMGTVANLFDVAMVFAVALMVALVSCSYANLGERFFNGFS